MSPKILIVCLITLALPACASMTTVGNKETQLLEPSVCSAPGIIRRDGACYQSTIISSPQGSHTKFTKSADGSKSYDIDNGSKPSWMHDMATTVQAIAVNKAMSKTTD